MCMPGDNVDMKVELITPIAIEKGLRFAIREGGRTVGSGVSLPSRSNSSSFWKNPCLWQGFFFFSKEPAALRSIRLCPTSDLYPFR